MNTDLLLSSEPEERKAGWLSRGRTGPQSLSELLGSTVFWNKKVCCLRKVKSPTWDLHMALPGTWPACSRTQGRKASSSLMLGQGRQSRAAKSVTKTGGSGSRGKQTGGLYRLRGHPFLHQLVHVPNSEASCLRKAESQSKDALRRNSG